MATIFALVNIPKAQLVGTANKSNTNKTISTGHLVKPKYETEIEVRLGHPTPQAIVTCTPCSRRSAKLNGE
jgi:2-keto-4-pentenoate hydratase